MYDTLAGDLVALKRNNEFNMEPSMLKAKETSKILSFPSDQEMSLTIYAGGGKTVSISHSTGKVTYEGFTPDEAAKAFWDAVERVYGERHGLRVLE